MQYSAFGDGEQSRDFTCVSNVVDANLLAVDAPDVAGQAFNVAFGSRVSLNKLLDEPAHTRASATTQPSTCGTVSAAPSRPTPMCPSPADLP